VEKFMRLSGYHYIYLKPLADSYSITMKKVYILMILFGSMYILKAQSPDNNPAFIQAEALAKANNCDEALLSYDKAISEDSNNPRYYLGKATCQYKLRMSSESLRTLNQAVKVKSDFLPAYQLMVKIHENDRNYAQAVVALKAQLPLERVPAKKLRLYSGMVRLYLLQNNIFEAEEVLAEARAINSSDLEVLYAEAEVLRAKKDNMQAIGFYERAILNLGKTSPSDAAKFYYGLGDAYMKINDLDNAVKAWQKARFGPYKKIVEAELMKTNPDFYLKMGISYFQANEYDEAMTQLNKAIEIKPDFGQAYRYMAMINDKRDLTAEAEKCFQKAILYEMAPDKKLEIEVAFLNMLMDNELYAKALPIAENILKEKPTHLRVMLQKAQAENNTSKYTSAARTVQKALSDPALSDATKKAPYYFVLGMSLKASGDVDGALEAFKLSSYGAYKGAAQNEIEMLQPEVY